VSAPASDPFEGIGRLAPFVQVANGAQMLRAVLDAPDLTDYQRMVGQGVVWSRVLGPALAQVTPNSVELVRATMDVVEAAGVFQAAGAGAEGAPDADAALAGLDGALDRLARAEPLVQTEYTERAETFIEMLRTDVPTRE
jgi:hypothetical protein